MENTPTNPTSKGKSKSWMIIAVLLLIVLVGALIYFLPKVNEYKTLLDEKETQRNILTYELDDLMKQHDSIKAEYGTLADSLSIKDSIIQANAAEIKQLLNYKWEYRKVNKKLNLLRNITQGYVVQLDSLFTVNRELKEENEKIRQQYNREQDRTRSLTRDKEELIEKVNQATILNAYEVKATTVRFTGSGRERDTDKAKKVERVKVCFKLGKNVLIEKGIKTIYVRIIRPDKVVVTQKIDGDYKFNFNGEELEYTIKKEVNYDQKEMAVCMYWGKKTDEAAMVGVYDVSVYTENAQIGRTTFELK